jgi:SAM-dependent methyltransferase
MHPRLMMIGRFVDRLASSGSKLLDVGCGPAALKKLLPDDIDYFGVDISDGLVAAHGDPSHFTVADLNTEPACFGGAQFDIVVCSGIFEYIEHVEPFGSFLARKVAPDGHLVLSYTNRQHYLALANRMRGTRPTHADPHRNFMSIPQALSFLSRHGFEVAQYATLTTTGGQPRLLARAVWFPLNAFNRQYVFLAARSRR